MKTKAVLLNSQGQVLSDLDTNLLFRRNKNNPCNLLTALQGKLLQESTKIIVLKYGFLVISESTKNNCLWMTHNCGLFSCLTALAWSILELQQAKYSITEINNSLSMSHFKNSQYCNSYNRLYEAIERDSAPLVPKTRLKLSTPYFNHHGSYSEIINNLLGHEWIKNMIESYMKPTARIKNKIEFLSQKYELIEKNTLFVCYRGTDKYKEVSPAPIEHYFNESDKFFDNHPKGRVIIQTDQEQVRQEFAQRYDRKCCHFEELPATFGTTVMHRTGMPRQHREEWCEYLIAAVIAASKCTAVVTHTGNVGFHIAMHALIAGKAVTQMDLFSNQAYWQ